MEHNIHVQVCKYNPIPATLFKILIFLQFNNSNILIYIFLIVFSLINCIKSIFKRCKYIILSDLSSMISDIGVIDHHCVREISSGNC